MNINLNPESLAADFDDEALRVEHCLALLCLFCFSNSANHGFWPIDVKRNKGEQLALIHSEVSECLEAVRKLRPSEHIPHVDNETEELADILIRVFDYAGGHNLDLATAFIEKFKFNLTRPVKHGKQF